VRKVAETRHLQVEIENVTNGAEIMKWPVLSTPSLVVNGKLVPAGRIPAEAEIAHWFAEQI